MEGFGIPSTLSRLMCDAKLEFFLGMADTGSIALEVLIICNALHERADEVVNCSDIEVRAPIARLLLPFVIDALRQIARRHLGELLFSQVLM